VLGGAASYFSLSASHFTKVYASSVVGADFPQEYWKMFETKDVGVKDVQQKPEGKTFFYDSTFSFDLYHRHANKTELNVLGEFEPTLGEKAKQSEFLYLATMPPAKQKNVLRQAVGRKLAFLDTIELYMAEPYRAELVSVLGLVDGMFLNDAEARMLGEEPNLIKCGKKIQKLGPKTVVIKKGEHGCLLFHENKVLPFPALPLEDIKDPTGAGDSFAGGFMGALAARGAVHPKLEDLKVAIAYGNVFGSFAVEEFSVDKLVKIKKEDIDKRYKEYCEMLRI
jgi:sugar/nucleoside kinase (ribokinase family)